MNTEIRKTEIHTTNLPHTEVRTTTKIEDDRSLGDKAKDMFHNAAEKTKEVAHDIKEKITGMGEVKDSDIAHAALKHDELKQKEELDRMQAEGAADRREQLQSDFSHLQNKEFEHRKEAEHHREKRADQAEKVAHLQNKQAQQQVEKCQDALKKGACPGEVHVTRVTEIH